MIVRQGDVLLRPVPGIPAVARIVPRDDGRLVLAYGEVTGHAHVIDASPDEATLLSVGERARFLRLVRDVELRHEEHATLSVPAGTYQVIQQRVWTDADEENWRYAGD
ncbi:MAG TPA: hypothetical protein VLR93_10385 [Patescibacteria group bacterium]|nr:hypothetical protein [Patescibacteria group bacterium]